MPAPKAALILNPRAGTMAKLADPAADLAAALRQAGFDLPAARLPDLPLDAQWAAALAGPAEIIFVAGGDGTLRDAARRLQGSARMLAPLPGGTMNRLCTWLGLPADPLEAAAAYRGAVPGWLDAGFAGNNLFLYQLIAGRVTRLMHFREMQRGSGVAGWWPLLRAILRSVARPAARNLRVVVAGRRLRGHALVVTLPAPDAPATIPRLMDVDIAAPGSPLAKLRQAWRWVRGRLREDTEVAEMQADRLAVHARDSAVRLSLDGEMLIARLPVRVRLQRDAVRILKTTGGMA
jgi:diacylglycerol kinase family enzyme